MSNECKNNYTESNFFTEFAKSESDIKKCNSCKYLDYDNGIITCKKFNKEDTD